MTIALFLWSSAAGGWKKSGKLRPGNCSSAGDVVHCQCTSSVPWRRDSSRPSNGRRDQREAGAKVAGQSARSHLQHADVQRSRASPETSSSSSSGTEGWDGPSWRGCAAAAPSLDAGADLRRLSVVRGRSSGPVGSWVLPRRRVPGSDAFFRAVQPPRQPRRSGFSYQQRLYERSSSSPVPCCGHGCFYWSQWGQGAADGHASLRVFLRIRCIGRELRSHSPDGDCTAQRLQCFQLRLAFCLPNNIVQHANCITSGSRCRGCILLSLYGS